jgi:predicted small integral membrane protein
MSVNWIAYALKVAAFFNVMAGIINLLDSAHVWALGNFTFALILMISSMLANAYYDSFKEPRPLKVKKKTWRPYDED